MIKIFYTILQKIINYKDNKKKSFFNNFCEEMNFLDIGAAEGLDARWDLLKEKINFFFVEPHPESSKDLLIEKKNIITKVFDEKPGLTKNFFLTNKPTCSSFLKPNINYLDKFGDVNRYHTKEILKFETTTVDKEFANLSLDFVKIDTQGSELNILKGSNKSLEEILGLEIECEFFKIYENQPLYEDIKNYLENYNLILFDFIDIIRWERDKFTHLGQPQFANILFLRSPENIIELYKKGKLNLKKLKNYILILTIYNKRDLLVSLQIYFEKINLQLDINNFLEITKRNSRYLNMIDHYSLILKRLINRRDRN